LVTSPDLQAVVETFVAGLRDNGVCVVVTAYPLGTLAGAGGVRAAVVADGACDECYQIDDGPTGYVVHGGGVLGVQYGVAALLEELGFCFFHPARTFVAGRVTRVSSPAFGVLHKPEQQRRGLHLHTLHPFEGYFDFWELPPTTLLVRVA